MASTVILIPPEAGSLTKRNFALSEWARVMGCPFHILLMVYSRDCCHVGTDNSSTSEDTRRDGVGDIAPWLRFELHKGIGSSVTTEVPRHDLNPWWEGKNLQKSASSTLRYQKAAPTNFNLNNILLKATCNVVTPCNIVVLIVTSKQTSWLPFSPR